MKVYRLAGANYKHDISGLGAAKIHTNRWNSFGTRILYTSESPALCAVELHKIFPPNVLIKNYHLLEIKIPDTKPLTIDQSFFDIKGNWTKNIYLTQQLGDYFITENKDLVLQVPSVWIQHCFNYLINPFHPDFNKVKIVKTYPFPFVGKLFK